MNSNSGQVNTDSGKMNSDSDHGAKSWYFPSEYAFTRNQKLRSRSARMSVHDRPEYAAPKEPEQNELTLTEDAIKFLESSPNPKAVLGSFAERITPSSWSGSQANVMQLRVDAMGQLLKHECPDISKAAKVVCEKMIQWVERQKEREQREDSEREQRFE